VRLKKSKKLKGIYKRKNNVGLMIAKMRINQNELLGKKIQLLNIRSYLGWVKLGKCRVGVILHLPSSVVACAINRLHIVGFFCCKGTIAMNSSGMERKDNRTILVQSVKGKENIQS
jgi:hypothetical protein